MSKRYTGNYIIRWTDKENNQKRKTYTDYPTALKARKWLLDSGVDSVDIAIELKTISGNINTNDKNL